MQSPIPESRAADAAWLEKKIREFGSASIEVLPPPTFKPRPPRKHPVAKPKVLAPPTASVMRRRMHGEVIVRLAHEGKSLREIASATGCGDTFIRSYLNECGLDIKAIRERLKGGSNEQIQHLKRLAADRYSCRYAAQIVGIKYEAARYIARKQGIKFSAPAGCKP